MNNDDSTGESEASGRALDEPRREEMRRISPTSFKVARRGTSREINRQIALNLIRARQPISRADLARLMGVRRGGVSRHRGRAAGSPDSSSREPRGRASEAVSRSISSSRRVSGASWRWT